MVIVPLTFLNLFIAFVLEKYSMQLLENSFPVTPDEYDWLLTKWADYDPTASGWILLKNVAFLIYELPAPMGRKFDYKELLDKTIEDEHQKTSIKNYEQSRSQEIQKKFVVHIEKDMILPQITVMQLYKELKLPVYHINGKYMCHFKDVVIKLSKMGLRNKKNHKFQIGRLRNEQLHSLNRLWFKKYKGLNKYQ